MTFQKGNKYGNRFSSTNQPKEYLVSEGMIRKNAEKNILAHLRTNLQDRNIISKVFDVVENEINEGNTKNAIELIKIAKEPEQQNVKITGQVQTAKLNQKDLNKIIDATKKLADEG